VSKIKPSLRKTSSKDYTEFMSGLSESMGKAQFGKRIVDSSADETSQFTFLRLKNDKNRVTAVYRHNLGDGLNYYRFYLKVSNGNIVFDDLFVYLAGETTTSTLGRMANMALSQFGVLDKIMGKERALVEAYAKTSKMTDLINQGKFAEGYKIYQELPAELQNEKAIQVQRYTAASNINETVFKEVCADLVTRYADEGSMNLLLIDGLFLTQEWAMLMRILDGLEASVGGDPFINTYRTTVLLAQEKHDEALALADKMMSEEITRMDAYATKIDVYIAKQQYAKVLETVEAAREHDISFDLELLREDPTYQPLLNSDVYKKWHESQTEQ